MLLIFQAFEAILLRTAGDLSHFHVVGTNIVKKLMNNHMKLICESLYASGYRSVARLYVAGLALGLVCVRLSTSASDLSSTHRVELSHFWGHRDVALPFLPLLTSLSLLLTPLLPCVPLTLPWCSPCCPGDTPDISFTLPVLPQWLFSETVTGSLPLCLQGFAECRLRETFFDHPTSTVTFCPFSL